MNFHALANIGMELFIIVVVLSLTLILLAYKFKPVRKPSAIILTLIGVVVSLTGTGAIIGIPLIFIGGILFFG